MALFDAKNFNPEVFGRYVDTIPNLNRNELLKSRAIVSNQQIATMFSDQTGGNYATTPIFGRIGGAPVNYDGSTDITATSMNTYTQSRIVIGRAKGWVERDFSFDITGGVDFMDQVGRQVAEYWDDIDTALLLSTMKGIFSMTGAANLAFVNGHTYDITAATTPTFDATTLNTAMQQALGDNKGKFALAIMHSAVATNLENLNLMERLKYTDANGIQRDLTLGTLNGRLVLVDDGMPVEVTTDTVPVTKYTTYVLGEGAIEYTNCGAKVPYEMDRDPAKNGGETTLYSRQRKIFAPRGISYSLPAGVISPTNTQIEAGANWTLANSNESTKSYFPHKDIAIARIITQG